MYFRLGKKLIGEVLERGHFYNSLCQIKAVTFDFKHPWSKHSHASVRYLATAQRPVLTLYTKNPCPLCDEALEKLQPYLEKVILEKVDITAPENQDWWKCYRYDIPVFHFDGEFLMKHKAEIPTFEKALDQWYKKFPRSS